MHLGEERHLRVKYLVQEHNTMSLAKAPSNLERSGDPETSSLTMWDNHDYQNIFPVTNT